MRWTGLAICGLWLAACQPAAGHGPVAPGAGKATAGTERPALLGQAFRFRFAIFLPDQPKADVAAELRNALAGTGFVVVSEPASDGLPPSPTSVFFAQPSIEDFALPAPESLPRFVSDMNETDVKRLGQSRAVVIFEVVGAASRTHDDYKKALVVAEKLGRKLGGFIWDEETRLGHTVEGWAKRRDGWQGHLPDVTQHVTIHAYRDGDLLRLVSLGMVKLGLPDVAIDQVTSSQSGSMDALLNLVMQHLAEGAVVDQNGRLRVSIDELELKALKKDLLATLVEGAKRELVVTLTPSEPDEGDADNRLLDLVFPGDPQSLQERQAEAIATLFGARDSVELIEHDDELLAARDRARKKLLALKPSYAKEPPFGEVLSVKAPFTTTDGKNEWMWVEVIRWQGDTVDGILKNEPYHVPDLRVGARVKVKEADLFDYILTRTDGTQEGNETGKVLESRAKTRK